MLTSVPVHINGASPVGTASGSSNISGEFKNEYFTKLGLLSNKKKGAFPGLSRGSTHTRTKSSETASKPLGFSPPLDYPAKPLPLDRRHNDDNNLSGSFSLNRSKSGNLAKFEKSLLMDKDADDKPDIKLPVLPPVPANPTSKSPHRLGQVPPQKYERLEAFKIYKNARKSATLDRLKVLGCQGRPNTPNDVTSDFAKLLPVDEERSPSARPVSRINLPPMASDGFLDVTRNFPNRTLSRMEILLDKPPRSVDIDLSDEDVHVDERPALRVMNLEPDIIPEELKAAPARSPTLPFHSTDYHPGAKSWAPTQTDKLRNLTRPSGGYGQHRRTPRGAEESPIMGGAVTAGKIPKCLLAPSQGHSVLLRQNYAKNLEKNWLKRQHEEKTRKKKEKIAVDWLLERRKGGRMNFEACFYSSDDGEDDEEVEDTIYSSEFNPRLMKSSSMDVLNSDISVSSNVEESEFISIQLENGELKDKIIKNKMRRKFAGRREKYKEIIKASRELEIAEKVAASIAYSNRDNDPEYIGGIDGMEGISDIDLAIDEMRYFTDTPGFDLPPVPGELSLTDKEIRAMRLKLKRKEDADDGLNYVDTSGFRALTAELLASINKKKAEKKKKKKKDGKKVKWNKNPDYNEYERSSPIPATCKDQFIADFGHWLEGRIDSRLRRESEAQSSEEKDGSPVDGESPDGEEADERPKTPCKTEVTLKDFGDDYELLTNILLDTRRPTERFFDQHKPKNPQTINEDDALDSPAATRRDNPLIAGMMHGPIDPTVKSDPTYADVYVPSVRRKSDPGVERLKQIKFIVPIDRKSSSKRGRRSAAKRRGSNYSVKSNASRRSSIKSVVSEAASEASCSSFKKKRPQTPGVYRIRRRISHARIQSGRSDVSDESDTMSVKSSASHKSNASRKGSRRSRQQSPEKRASSKNRKTSSEPSTRSASSSRRRSHVSVDTMATDESGSRPTSATSTGSAHHIDVEEFIIDLDDNDSPRPGSARRLHRAEPEIDLWDLTKGLDFAAKDVKIKIVNRKRRRQRKKKLMKQQAEVRALAKANKLADQILSGKPADGRQEAGEDSITDSSSDSEEEAPEPEPPKPMTFALDSPFVSACMAWKTSSRMKLRLTNDELDAQIAKLSPLFREMKECRYIRWSARDWAIIERLYELELLE